MTKYIIHRHRIRIRSKHLIHALDIPITRQFINDVRNHLLFMQDSLNEINLGVNDTATPYIPPASPSSSSSPTPHITTFPGAQYSQLQNTAIHQAQRFVPPTIGNHTAKINAGGLTGWLISHGFAKRQSQAIVILLIMSALFFVSSFVVYHFLTRDPNTNVDAQRMKDALIRIKGVRQ